MGAPSSWLGRELTFSAQAAPLHAARLNSCARLQLDREHWPKTHLITILTLHLP